MLIRTESHVINTDNVCYYEITMEKDEGSKEEFYILHAVMVSNGDTIPVKQFEDRGELDSYANRLFKMIGDIRDAEDL